MAAEIMRLEAVSLRTSHSTLLEDISFQVSVGDRLSLVGHSGSGKTSLLRLLNRLSDPSQGKIFFEGQDIHDLPVIPLRQQVTLVPQESRLLGMTVSQALSYPLALRTIANPQQQITPWLEKLRIPSEWLDRQEVQLSVGQRQWIAIARALILQPKILLLDEPTSSLDAGRAAHLLQVLTELAQTQGTAIVMVNHQLDLAQQFGDRVLHLQQGKLIENLVSSQIDWAKLQQNLRQAEIQSAQEWE
jgi:D-methionine transport system ATP-binding protein